MKEEENKSTFKVNDNRRFDNQGNERQESKTVASTAGKTNPAPQEPKAKPQAEKNESKGQDVGSSVSDNSALAGSLGETLTSANGGGPNKNYFSEKDAAEGDPEAMDFSSFVMSLATQALMQLGALKPPDTGYDIPVDREAAKQTIEILRMLHRKTKGNLEQAEQNLLEDILHNLRLSYVKVS